MSKESIVIALVGLLAVAGCDKGGGGSPAQHEPTSETPAATAVAENAPPENAALGSAAAKEMFKARCATCHGNEGKGNGPGAVTLNPKPRNYTDKTWQASVTDDQIRKTIVYGGAAVGKSPMMPASPDLDAKPEVVDGLVRIVRSFRD
ncbi:MAG TPA: cytochrome c [Polyangiaceae bacterium]|jgi:cytochrome c553